MGHREAQDTPRRVFGVAPEEELLYSLSPDGSRRRIHPLVSRGRFLRLRRALAWVLMAAFFGLPHLPVGGRPALLLDWGARRFHVFGTTFHATDTLLLLAFGAGIIVTIFFVASTVGRMWCGYLCPQLIWLEFLFRPLEALLEGPPSRRRLLDRAPWGPVKILRRGLKGLLFTAAALAMAVTFFAYFVPRGELLAALGDPAGPGRTLALAVAGLTALITFDVLSFRDQMCTVACPYGRLQNVLADRDTVIVSYDPGRGEPRRKGPRAEGEAAGDCVDCGRCVATCPTGMDIRRGLQMECVGCAQCIDACDDVMDRLRRPRGLIRYTSQRALEGGRSRVWRPRLAAYLVLFAAAWGALVWVAATRAEARVEILRTGRESYRLLPGGEVANQQRLRITNHLPEPQAFTVDLTAPEGASLVVAISPMRVGPDAVETVDLVARVPAAAFRRGRVDGRYRIRSDRGFDQEHDVVLLGPWQ
ncbi:MAG: cytochrome c oxidase accessory protein CcoG [Deltaproteobacteria bacterium]|nr:cytochrome c oxidase accessory protein CcoG [Deltaproteobacteria bacterium]